MLPMKQHRGGCMDSPLFEPLEQRLLLTTVHGGEFFLYLNSQGEAVRLDLNVADGEDPNDATIELFGYDAAWGGIHDLVGFYNGDPANSVFWQHDGEFAEVVERNDDGDWSWINFSPTEPRGANTEIFAIYVAECTPGTVLTISTLASAAIPETDWADWYNNVNTWDSGSLPILDVVNNVQVTSPSGSGGVVVGSRRDGTVDNPIRHMAADAGDSETVVDPIGWFPGGELKAGISVPAQYFQMINLPVGSNVHAVATDSTGAIYVMDLTALQGVIVNADGAGVIGQAVDSLATDSAGTFYAVDNDTTASIIGDPTDQDLGSDVRAIAVDNAGVFYVVDEATHHLFSWSTGDGYQDIGALIDQAVGQFRYENVTALDYNPFDGTLYAIADLVDTDTLNPPSAPVPSGPFLITIDTVTARVTSRVLIGGNLPVPGDPIGEFASLAFKADGSCYAVYTNPGTNEDELHTVNIADGACTLVNVLRDGVTAILGVGGIDFIGDTLYGVTNNWLYQINPATAACTDMGAPALPAGMSSLAYDPTRPGSVYTAVSVGGYRFCRIPLGSSLMTTTAAVAAPVDVLVDATDDTWVWGDVYAMDYNVVDTLLYAIATGVDLDPIGGATPPAGRRLVTIDSATGLVTDVGALTGAADLQTLAFTAGGNLYGVDTTANDLFQINPATGAGALIVGLGVADVTGIEFVPVGANEVLYGVTATELYALDMATGAGTLLANTGQTTLGSLAYDTTQPGILWSTASENGYRLTRIELSSMLVEVDVAGMLADRLATLFDAAEPAYAYTNIHALEFDGADTLYGVGTIVNIDPVNVADPASSGPYLITIDTTTGLVTRQAGGTPLAEDLSSLAYDATAGIWYGVDPDAPAGDQLVQVDMATAALTPVAVLTDDATLATIVGVVGLDFEDGTLHAVTGDLLYSVDPATAMCTEMGTAAFSTMSSLSGDPAQATQLWSTAILGDKYYLISIETDPDEAIPDIDRLIVAGTVAGQITSVGNVGLIEMGFLWGNVIVGESTDAIITRAGGGAVPVGDTYATPGESRITVGRTLNGVYTRSDTLYTAIEAGNDLMIDPLPDAIAEHEVRVDPDVHDARWVQGDLVDFYNDSMATAQFLNHTSGNFSLNGNFSGGGFDSLEDWYALPLMAGQTVIVDGSLLGCWLHLYDWAGNWMDSFGYETIEDEGVGSRGSTPKPMTFTAPAAGIYYVLLSDVTANGDGAVGGAYSLNFMNGTAAALGGVGIVGNYYGMYDGTGSADAANIATKLGGDLGGVAITGSSYYTTAYAIDGGNLVAFQAGELGTPIDNIPYTTNTIVSDSNIGRVASTVGFLDASIIAGADDGLYNPDAYIQNIYAATNYVHVNTISATGSIGVIETEGDFGANGGFFGLVEISINSNSSSYVPGMGPRLDLLAVGGNCYALDGAGNYMFSHGPGGDIGFVHVGGTILVSYGDWSAPLTETTYSDGRSTTLNDDGGGQITITPVATILVDDDGNTIYDDEGNAVTFAPTYSYAYIPVDGGVGGVIANLRVNGSATFSTTGVVHIGDLDLFGAGGVVTIPEVEGEPHFLQQITFGGSGDAHVYYMNHHENPADLDVILDINSTGGNLVSGNLTAHVQRLHIAGNIGPVFGATGAWVHGREYAPVSADTSIEPQYGWFHGKLNGLQVTGDLDRLSVHGSLGDLRVIGRIGTITVNADNFVPAHRWHGVNGIVFSDTRIDTVYLGDGLADDGGSDVAKAAIMSGGSIGTVEITGPYHTVDVGSYTVFEQLDGLRTQAYGEVNGSIIGRHNTTEDVTDQWGNVTTVEQDAVGRVGGTDGARMTALVLGFELNSFQCFKGTFAHTGSVGTVSFSGFGAEIEGSEISGHYVRKVSVSGSTSYGISNTHVSGSNPPANGYVVNLVQADGPGMDRLFISANGGSIGTVKGLGATSDIYNSVFTSTNGMNYLGARDLNTNGIHMPGAVGTIRASGDATSNTVKAGAISRVSVSGDFELNSFEIAGKLSSMTVDGAFIDSYLAMHGPSVAYLVSLLVTGDISGEIISAGKIGSIVSKAGSITADISTIVNGWSGDINLIQTAGGYTGALEVVGSLNKFVSGAALGDNPDTTGSTQTFNIWGGLGHLKVGGDLFAGFNVGGDVGTMDIDGTFYSNTFVNGNMTSLVVDGGLGGILGGLGIRGSLTVLGDLKKMKFNTASDLFADLTVGGDIKKMRMQGGSIIGDLTSRYGSIGSIDLRGGNIAGNVQAASFGKINVRGGNITGNITATNGNIKSLSVSNGDLDADVLAENGRIDKLRITNGSATAGHTIEATGGIGAVSVKNGNLDADLISGAGIKKFAIAGGNLTGMVNATGDIDSFRLTGNIIGTTVRSGGQIKKFSAVALNNATISSAWNMGAMRISGNATNSHILAGFDVGDDGLIGTADDNPFNGGVVHSGNIKSLAIRGALDGSIVAAGIDGGAGGYLNLADNVEAAGESSIKKMSVRGGFGAAPATSGVLADTSIYQKFADEAIAAGVVVNSGITTVLNGAGIDFGPNTVQGKTLTDGALTLTLSSGRANYDPATGNLVLEETTSRSSLNLNYTGAVPYPTVIVVTGSDDSGLSSFRVRGDVTLGNMTIDGSVKTLGLANVANGAAWVLPGGVKSAKIAALTNVAVTAGEVGTWSMTGSYNSGNFTVASVKSFRTNGMMGADFNSVLGGVGAVSVRNGNFDGDMTVRGKVKTLSVKNDLAGDVVVTSGDLSSVKVGSLSGTVNVIDGASKSVTIATGDFGGAAETSYRTAAGIGSFRVSRGDFSGLLSTRGDLKRLSVKGEMSGRAWSGGNIRSMTVGSMNNALVAASGDLTSATVKGDMYGSYILAGFDPGDAGFDNPAGSGEDANIQRDAVTNPAWQIAENTDHTYGGTIKSVRIGGDMGRQAVYNPVTRRWDYNYDGSTIAAGVGPGEDGYWGTDDDVVSGVGYVKKVRVTGGIFGSGGADESYGVFAASEMPKVYNWKNRPFEVNGNAHVGMMHATAGPLTVTSVQMLFNSIAIYFSHPVNFATVGTVFTGMAPESFTVIASADSIFDPLVDTVVSETVPHTLTYNSASYSVTLTLAGGVTWEALGAGNYYQLTLDASVVADNRGVLLDGEYAGDFPTGDDEPGGDFVYSGMLDDAPDTFEDAVGTPPMLITLDGGTQILGSTFESGTDVDIFGFAGNQYDYFSVAYVGNALAEMAVFMRDTQGTPGLADDTFEALARWEYMSLPGETIFEAFELPESGEYYVVVAPSLLTWWPEGGPYQVELTMSSSDTQLVADLGGTLPAGEEIAYISNVIGDNNNNLGANNPKQLVYLDFDGGTATKYFDDYGVNVDVDALDLADIDITLDGNEDILINSGAGVTGIVDNILTIFTNTPASHPLGSLTVQSIDVANPGDWAAYLAATEGLWFTTVDPTVAQGLDPETDFTTVFIGAADTLAFGGGGGLLGIASEIDVANQSEADNALVFAQNFDIYTPYTSGTDTDRLNQFSRALANVAAHELGHTLGLNHQPTDSINYMLLADDPDNDPITPDDSNTGAGLMAYVPITTGINELLELGTAELTGNEFPVGHLDTTDLLLRWLS